MSLVVRCDRCRAERVIQNRYDRQAYPLATLKAGWDATTDRTRVDADLCEPCLTALTVWVQAGAQARATDGGK